MYLMYFNFLWTDRRQNYLLLLLSSFSLQDLSSNWNEDHDGWLMFGPQHYFDFQPFFGKRKFYEMLAGVTRFVEFTHDAQFTPMHTRISAHNFFHSTSMRPQGCFHSNLKGIFDKTPSVRCILTSYCLSAGWCAMKTLKVLFLCKFDHSSPHNFCCYSGISSRLGR